MRKLDFGRLRAAQRDQAMHEVRASLVLDTDRRRGEASTVTDEEMDRELLMLSIQTREPLETLRERLTEDGGLERHSRADCAARRPAACCTRSWRATVSGRSYASCDEHN